MNPQLNKFKAALLLRLNALIAMPNTQLLKSRRFGFLGALALAAIIGVKINAKPDLPEIIDEPASASVIKTSDIDLTRYDGYIEDGDHIRFVTERVNVKPGESLGPLLQDLSLIHI